MRPVVLLLTLLLPLPLAAQQRIDRRMAVSSTASIRINDLVGMVRLVGWDRDSLVVVGELPARAGQLYFGGSRDAAKLGLEGTDTSSVVSSATLEVRVPRAGARERARGHREPGCRRPRGRSRFHHHHRTASSRGRPAHRHGGDARRQRRGGGSGHVDSRAHRGRHRRASRDPGRPQCDHSERCHPHRWRTCHRAPGWKRCRARSLGRARSSAAGHSTRRLTAATSSCDFHPRLAPTSNSPLQPATSPANSRSRASRAPAARSAPVSGTVVPRSPRGPSGAGYPSSSSPKWT